ncbi:paired amphipathic helix protein Sin3-like 2 [Eucalyptus grandis]|uniref:paired amphipathic helix protein Sin3-like 2 n=1 Tax=Eucalyptus grandis TaxID=71139 RepID=UPI00192E8C4B|nr:paired amphipathic helix protein Sin3-like 2 [Eucalyptus grandis]
MEGTRVAVHPSREEHYGQPLGGVEGDAEGSARRPTTDDAMSYLGELKDTLRDEPEKYNTFVEIMKDFKSQRIDAMMVVARVKELFTGYERLIHGFNTFLPDGCKISPDEPRKLVSFEEVIGFVIKVKERFQSEENVYLSFLDAWRGNNPIRVVYNEVAGLFAGHPDLLEEFKRLLPEISQDQEEVSSITTPTSRRLEMDRTRQDGIADSQAKDRATVDHPHLDDDEEIMKVYEDEVKRFEGRVQLIVSAIYSVLAILVFLLALWIYRGN